jgi:hypothetical protein
MYQTAFDSPVTLVFIFPESKLWMTMTGLPVSASQTRIRHDIYSIDGRALSSTDENSLREFGASGIQAHEAHYAATKFIRFEGVPEHLPSLKAHLQLERHAGRVIYPAKRESGNSASFCKAEKRMSGSIP